MAEVYLRFAPCGSCWYWNTVQTCLDALAITNRNQNKE